MKCVCGRKTVLKLERGETKQDFINRSRCPTCGRTGELRELYDDEARWA